MACDGGIANARNDLGIKGCNRPIAAGTRAGATWRCSYSSPHAMADGMCSAAAIARAALTDLQRAHDPLRGSERTVHALPVSHPIR